MPLFGDTCRDELNLNLSGGVSALLFGAALLAAGITVWASFKNTVGTAQFLLICLHESCCCQLF